MVDQALAEACAGFRGGEGLGLQLVAPQAVVERLGRGEQGFDRLAAAGVDDVVGVLAGGQLDEAERALGRRGGEGARRGADGGLLSRAVAVEAEDRRRVEPPHALELGLGDRRAVGRDGFGDTGAVEGDDVHIAFDHDQPPGGAAGGAGAVEIVERAALVEERRLRGVEIFGLAGAEDAAAEAR